MGWTDLIGMLLVLVVLLGIIRVMFRTRKPSADEVKTPWMRSFFSSTFLAGLLSAVAVGAMVHDSARGQGGGWLLGVTLGACVAFLFAPLSFGGKWNSDGLFTALLSALFGAIGLIVTVGTYFTPQGVCTPADVGQRALGFVVVAVALTLGAALAWTRGLFAIKNLGPSLLAVFGTLQVLDLLVFLSNPLGLALTGLGLSAWTITLVTALALGFAASIWPELVLTVTGISVAAGAVYVMFSGTVNALCTPGVTDPTALAPLIGYVVVFAGIRLVLARVLGAKQESSSTR